MNIREAINLLELSLPVTEESIKKAFRMKARLYHPDNFRIYEQQIEAARYFIKIREAYEYLQKQSLETINRFSNFSTYEDEGQAPRMPDPRRGEVDFSASPLFREFANLFSLFYLFRKWQLGKLFRVFKYFSPEVLYHRIVRPRSRKYPVYMNGFLMLLNGFFRLTTFLLVLMIFCAIVFMLLPTLFIGAMIFFPLFWMYSRSNEFLLERSERILGHRPAPGSRHRGGEITYLFIRSVPVLITDLLLGWMVYELFSVSGMVIHFLLSGICFFMFILTLSVVYEWIAFFKMRILRKKI